MPFIPPHKRPNFTPVIAEKDRFENLNKRKYTIQPSTYAIEQQPQQQSQYPRFNKDKIESKFDNNTFNVINQNDGTPNYELHVQSIDDIIKLNVELDTNCIDYLKYDLRATFLKNNINITTGVEPMHLRDDINIDNNDEELPTNLLNNYLIVPKNEDIIPENYPIDYLKQEINMNKKLQIGIRARQLLLHKFIQTQTETENKDKIHIITLRQSLRRMTDFLLYGDDKNDSNPKFMIVKLRVNDQSILLFNTIVDEIETENNNVKPKAAMNIKILYGYAFEESLNNKNKDKRITLKKLCEQYNNNRNDDGVGSRNNSVKALMKFTFKNKNKNTNNIINVLMLNEIDCIQKHENNQCKRIEIKLKCKALKEDSALNDYSQAKLCGNDGVLVGIRKSHKISELTMSQLKYYTLDKLLSYGKNASNINQYDNANNTNNIAPLELTDDLINKVYYHTLSWIIDNVLNKKNIKHNSCVLFDYDKHNKRFQLKQLDGLTWNDHENNQVFMCDKNRNISIKSLDDNHKFTDKDNNDTDDNKTEIENED